ncbi:MAG: alpha/beta hydrolase [Rhodobacteraceae bacterium]|nr:alpha/beta hydrolase [Paracoccaceae bacterium]
MGRLTADYAQLLDNEVRAFLARSDTFYPPDAVKLTIADQRRVYDDMCAAFRQPRPASVQVRDETAGNVPCRIYEKGPCKVSVIYFHGGGFVVGGLDSHDDICAEICDRTGLRVVAVDYRLCPEHPHPAAFHDAREAARWAAATWPDNRFILVGDSAGGNLAAALAQHNRRDSKVPLCGQVLIYPGLGGDVTRGSYVAHAEAPGLTLSDLAFYQKLRAGDAGIADVTADPTFLPLADSDFSGLPPTVVVSAECDPLCDDGDIYCARITGAGGRAHWIREDGLVHAYLRARNMSRRAGDSFGRIVQAIAALSEDRWPYEG